MNSYSRNHTSKRRNHTANSDHNCLAKKLRCFACHAQLLLTRLLLQRRQGLLYTRPIPSSAKKTSTANARADQNVVRKQSDSLQSGASTSQCSSAHLGVMHKPRKAYAGVPTHDTSRCESCSITAQRPHDLTHNTEAPHRPHSCRMLTFPGFKRAIRANFVKTVKPY